MANRSEKNYLRLFLALGLMAASYGVAMAALTWLTGSFAIPIICTIAVGFASLFFIAIKQDLNRHHSRANSRNSDVFLFDRFNPSYNIPTFSPQYMSPIAPGYFTSLTRDSDSHRHTSHYHPSPFKSHHRHTSHHHPSDSESRSHHTSHHHPSDSESHSHHISDSEFSSHHTSHHHPSDSESHSHHISHHHPSDSESSSHHTSHHHPSDSESSSHHTSHHHP